MRAVRRGHRAPVAGIMWECSECAEGTASNARTACTECPVGTFALAGAAECAPCLKGSYSAAPGASRCELADAGTFVPDDGAAAVVPCFEGEYAPSRVPSPASAAARGRT